MESWKYDGMESWKHAWITDQMESWMNGIMEIWCNGIMEAWPFWNQFRSHFKVIFGDLEARFGDILEAGRPDEAKWGLEGSRAILTGKTHAIVRVTPISLQSGEPRTLKHCKNTYNNEPPIRPGTVLPFTGLIHRQNPYRINLFGEFIDDFVFSKHLTDFSL